MPRHPGPGVPSPLVGTFGDRAPIARGVMLTSYGVLPVDIYTKYDLESMDAVPPYSIDARYCFTSHVENFPRLSL